MNRYKILGPLWLASVAAMITLSPLAYANESKVRTSESKARSKPVAQAPAGQQAAGQLASAATTPRYLFFKDGPRMTPPSVVPPTLDLKSLGSFTPSTLQGRRVLRAPELAVPSLTRTGAARTKTAQTSLIFTPSGKVPDRRALTVGLTARASTDGDRPYAAPNTLDAASSQTIGMAVAVGYRGFSIEAGYLRNEALALPTTEGIDVGISYAGRDWKTSVQVAGLETSKSSAPLTPFLPDRNYTVELGGAYAISSRLAVTGGVKYAISYPQQGFRLKEEVEHSSAVYLGTALKF
jgi:hypothetical protein